MEKKNSRKRKVHFKNIAQSNWKGKAGCLENGKDLSAIWDGWPETKYGKKKSLKMSDSRKGSQAGSAQNVIVEKIPRGCTNEKQPLDEKKTWCSSMKVAWKFSSVIHVLLPNIALVKIMGTAVACQAIT